MEGQPHIVLNIDTSKGGNQEGIQFLLQGANGKHHSAIVKEHTASFSQILLEPTTIVKKAPVKKGKNQRIYIVDIPFTRVSISHLQTMLLAYHTKTNFKEKIKWK